MNLYGFHAAPKGDNLSKAGDVCLDVRPFEFLPGLGLVALGLDRSQLVAGGLQIFDPVLFLQAFPRRPIAWEILDMKEISLLRFLIHPLAIPYRRRLQS
ncbi:hypothetical protein ACVITL_001663 [Rhizobium pisi]|uniref:hypothetical protein n=1 Tax=Rhizobium TaxID=379 RepID=UPI003D039AA1